MTEIRSIQALPESEIVERSALVPKLRYLPYLSMTEGEMRLALLGDQARMYAAFYEAPEYDAAAQMIDNALYRGVANRQAFVGALTPLQQQIAREIDAASRRTRPASGLVLMERKGMERPKGALSGIHIGDPILPHDSSLDDCNKYAIQYVRKYYQSLSTAQILARLALPLLNQNLVKKFNEGKAICKSNREVERILNESITLFGHHTMYGYLPGGGNILPAEVTVKRLLHAAGQEDLARLTGANIGNMKTWLNTAIMQRNAQGNIGPIGQHQTNISWTGLPAEAINEYLALTGQNGEKVTNSIAQAQIIMNLLKKYGQANIGVDPATAKLIIDVLKTVLLAIVAAAPAIISALKNQRADAFSGSRGIGTEAFNPSTGDWSQSQPSAGAGGNNTLLMAAAVLGGIYLLSDNETES